MKKRLLGLAALGFMLFAFVLAATPLWAQQGVEDKIKSLEQELARLKSEQVELKKEATAAAAALPTYAYRPGDGMTISAADQSWAANFSWRLNIHMYNHPEGRPNVDMAGLQVEDKAGTTEGELFPRRNRFYFNHCWDDCFYEFLNSIDGESRPRAASFRDSELAIHFEQWNPYYPKFNVGLRKDSGQTHVARSSSTDAKLEHNMIFGWGDWGGDGSHAGFGLHWDRVPAGSGDMSLFLNLATSQQGTHQEFLNSDRKGVMGFAGIRPFSKTKDYFMNGLEFGVGYQANWISRADGRSFEIVTHERRGEQVLFGAILDADDNSQVGDGYSYIFIPGVKWRIGPYQVRGNWHKTQTAGHRDPFKGLDGKGWNISTQVFLFSPKGPLTGSPTTPGSVLIGFDFERVDAECGAAGCNAEGANTRIAVLNREAALWYFIRPSMRVGTWVHWWQSSNTPLDTQRAIGCTRAATNEGKECDWFSYNFGLQYQW